MTEYALVRFLLGNLWRTGCIVLLLALGVQSWRAARWESKHDAKVAENALASEANRAAVEAVHTAQAEAKAANERAAVYEHDLAAVQAARAKAEAQAAAKLKRAQSALQAALEAQKEWAATPVPEGVRKALR